MAERSLDAAYFDGIFRDDADPWGLASSEYEAAKFDATIAAIADRRYARGFEIGCAHGVLTARLATLCDDLLAVDISDHALARAAERVGNAAGVRLRRLAFPGETPDETGFDLIVLSEVAYYWSDADLELAAEWIATALAPGGRILLVHWVRETDYPQSGDGAVTALQEHLADAVTVETAHRTADYRLDLWRRT